MSRPGPVPPPAALTRLAEKYRTLAALREKRDHEADAKGASPAPTSREALRALSQAFPGCLRELDTLGLAELRRRASVAAAAATSPSDREPWMDWILCYHRLLGAALAVKRTPDVAPDALLRQAATAAGEPLSAELVALFLRPPGGRLVPVVLREVAERFGVAPATVAKTLLPARRRTDR